MRVFACDCAIVCVHLCFCYFPLFLPRSSYICSDISVDSRKVFTNTPTFYLGLCSCSRHMYRHGYLCVCTFPFRTEMGKNTRLAVANLLPGCETDCFLSFSLFRSLLSPHCRSSSVQLCCYYLTQCACQCVCMCVWLYGLYWTGLDTFASIFQCELSTQMLP